MLGLADRSRVIDLFEALMKGDIAGALKELRDQYDSGADPAVVLNDLAEFTPFCHPGEDRAGGWRTTRSLAEAERNPRARLRGRAVDAGARARLADAVQRPARGPVGPPSPIAAAEMVLVRIAYAADLPTPDEVVRSLTSSEGAASARPQGGGETSGPTARADAPREALARMRPGTHHAARRAPRWRPRRNASSRSSKSRRRQQADAAPDVAAAPTLARFEDLIALAAEQPRPADQDRARTRPAAGPLRAGTARDCARAQCLQGPDRRSRTQDQPVDGSALDGGGLERAKAKPTVRLANRVAPSRAERGRAGRPAGKSRARSIPGAPRSWRVAKACRTPRRPSIEGDVLAARAAHR